MSFFSSNLGFLLSYIILFERSIKPKVVLIYVFLFNKPARLNQNVLEYFVKLERNVSCPC